MNATRVPVLIIGAGGGGLSLSLLLPQQGVSPLLVERRSDISWYPAETIMVYRWADELRKAWR
jgi:flavin-dependent dehydrogenase